MKYERQMRKIYEEIERECTCLLIFLLELIKEDNRLL